MVSAADERAAAAGTEMLRAGGSATDAAIATMLALGVVEPLHSGVGGGAFYVHSDPRGRVDTLDGREAAPAAADPYWFYVGGRPLSHGAAVPGGRSVGVPGSLRVMAAAHKAHGKLPWARLFQPAIALAEGGFQITPRLHNFLITYKGDTLNGWARAYLYNANGVAKATGTTIRNPEIAALYRQIAAHGADYLYTGAQGQRIVDTVNNAPRNASKMTMADLAAYQAKVRAPICGMYRGYKICGMGPPSSGGIIVLTILKQLERFDMAKLGPQSPVAWHLFAESSRLAYADRDTWLGDPDKIGVPVAGLLDAGYIARRSALISPDTTMATIEPGQLAGAPPRQRPPPVDEHGTTDLAVVDRWGDTVEVTTTIESVFGSQLSTNGIFLNNELTDFDIVPDKDGYLAANAVAAGKRPRSSMSPTIVYGPDGTMRIAVGAAGGSTIIAQVAKALIAVIDWRMSAQDAITLGLIYAPSAGGVAEKGTILEPMLPQLAALGEKLQVATLGLKANAVERVNGQLAGGADPRSEGVVMAENGATASVTRAIRPVNAPSE